MIGCLYDVDGAAVEASYLVETNAADGEDIVVGETGPLSLVVARSGLLDSVLEQEHDLGKGYFPEAFYRTQLRHQRNHCSLGCERDQSDFLREAESWKIECYPEHDSEH